MSSINYVPNNDLPPLPPSKDIETRAILRRAIATNRALADLKNKADHLSNQDILVRLLNLIPEKFFRIHHFIFHSLIFRFLWSKLTPILTKVFPLPFQGVKYSLLSICFNAAAAVPSSLNSKQ